MKNGSVASLVGPLLVCGAHCGCDRDPTRSAATLQPPTPAAFLVNIGDVPAGDRCHVLGVLSQQVSPHGALDAKGSTFDLLGVDAPALDEPGGPESRAFLQGLLTKRKVWAELTGANKADPRHGFVNLYLAPGRGTGQRGTRPARLRPRHGHRPPRAHGHAARTRGRGAAAEAGNLGVASRSKSGQSAGMSRVLWHG
ncbi:MAG TPA: hypothetical protein VD971_13470 [Phycisphaerales bacterium]|nr:hypothetical protein [Phycisphaerales bacterium]